MTLTVGQRIEAQGAGLVGREAERAFLHSVLGEEGPLVVFIHGIGGLGKSALVEAFTAEARARAAIVLLLDSGTIERQEKYLSLAEDQLLFEGRIVRRPELA